MNRLLKFSSTHRVFLIIIIIILILSIIGYLTESNKMKAEAKLAKDRSLPSNEPEKDQIETIKDEIGKDGNVSLNKAINKTNEIVSNEENNSEVL